MDIEELKALLTDVMKEYVPGEVTKQVADHIKANGLDVQTFEEKFKAMKLDTKSVKDEAVKKTGEFFNALYRQDRDAMAGFKSMEKSMGETTGAGGGFLVPEEFATEVYRVVEDFGLVAKMAFKMTMNTDTMNVPTLGSSVTFTYPGEEVPADDSTPSLNRIQLIAKTGVGLTAISNTLLADANPSVVQLLTRLFAEAIAGEIDRQGLAGTGTPYTGVLNNPDVATVQLATGKTTFASADLADYRAMITGVKPWSLQGAGFFMHRTVWGNIQTLRTGGTNSGDFFGASTNPVIVGAQQGFPLATAGYLWGYPVYLSDKLPALTQTALNTPFAIFGNLEHVFFGARQDIAVDMFNSGTIGNINLITQNMSGMRITTRHAIAVGLPEAFSVLRTSLS